SFSFVAELDVQPVSAQDHGHAMKGIAMPGRRLARRQPLSPHQVIAAMMQHLLIGRELHSCFLQRRAGSSRGEMKGGKSAAARAIIFSENTIKDAAPWGTGAAPWFRSYWPIEAPPLAGTSREVMSKVSMNPLVPLNSNARSLSR